MKIEIQDNTNSRKARRMRKRISYLVGRSLKRFQGRVRSVRVRLTDLNSIKGGEDKEVLLECCGSNGKVFRAQKRHFSEIGALLKVLKVFSAKGPVLMKS